MKILAFAGSLREKSYNRALLKEAVKFTLKAHNKDYTVDQISKWLSEHSVKKSINF